MTTPNLNANWDEFQHEYDHPLTTTRWEGGKLLVEVRIPARHWHKDWEGDIEKLPTVYHVLTIKLDPKDLAIYDQNHGGSTPVLTTSKEKQQNVQLPHEPLSSGKSLENISTRKIFHSTKEQKK